MQGQHNWKMGLDGIDKIIAELKDYQTNSPVKAHKM